MVSILGKTSGSLLIKSSLVTQLFILILSQKSFDVFKNVLPIKLGSSSLITSKLKFGIQISLTLNQ